MQYLTVDQTRILVEVPISPVYDLKQIKRMHKEKITKYMTKLEISTLDLQDIIFSYQRY